MTRLALMRSRQSARLSRCFSQPSSWQGTQGSVGSCSSEVYVALTNNDGRGDKHPTDKSNPRPQNLHGQILRFKEQGADPSAETFTWELFLLAGEHGCVLPEPAPSWGLAWQRLKSALRRRFF
jgi:hypothetical protein